MNDNNLTPFYEGKRDVEDLDTLDLQAMQALMMKAMETGGEYEAGVHEGMLDQALGELRSFLSSLSLVKRGEFFALIGSIMQNFRR